MFTKILIANRGEIACRVAATAKRMGIQTVAVYSEADAGAKHVAVCDEAVLIGPAAAKESYLRADKMIEVALASGVQAIHPGYGFLSENAQFAQACMQAGLVFIGPPATAIQAMGSKSAAKALMEKARVPLVPGYHGEQQDPDFLQRQADSIAYPVLLKASAGGGGKGMRIVTQGADFKAALASCKREASNSFGDDKVLVEKYLTRPRHIEIQIFADSHGACLYLFERDCSVQRRHQKVLEEAPAPGMTPERRRAMGEAAVAAAKAVGYVGAGTVEFIANQDGSFYFMEMNTRLQVEHPVTEMITGLDLVEWQLRVAYGEHLPLRQEQLQLHGHALEARIYAENPDKGFLPSIGTLQHMRTPAAQEFTMARDTGATVRIDSGVRQGDTISPFYDPMIAKLIVWGQDRQHALSVMANALAQYQIVGLASNVGFLQRLVCSQPFSTADLDTGLIERHQQALFPTAQPLSVAVLALATAALLQSECRAQESDDADPWRNTRGWRLNGNLLRQLHFVDAGKASPVEVIYQSGHWLLRIAQDNVGSFSRMKVLWQDGNDIKISVEDHTITGTVVRDGEQFHVFSGGNHTIIDYIDPLVHAGEAETENGRLTAPMPGKIVAVLVKTGEQVKQGAPLLIMEAMKMEHTITAPMDGTIEELLYQVGDQVVEAAQLLVFKG